MTLARLRRVGRVALRAPSWVWCILTLLLVGTVRCAVRCPALSRPPPDSRPEPLANGKTAPAGTSQRDVPTIQERCQDAPSWVWPSPARAERRALPCVSNHENANILVICHGRPGGQSLGAGFISQAALANLFPSVSSALSAVLTPGFGFWFSLRSLRSLRLNFPVSMFS